MPDCRIAVSAVIRAPVGRVYEIVADYEHGHHEILPSPPFVSMAVVRGGVGAGTEINLTMRVLGRTRSLQGIVSEPQPGRVIVERYRGQNLVTSFSFEPAADGQTTTVTITTDAGVHGGWWGAAERWFLTRWLRPVYDRELRKLDALASRPQVAD